MNHLTRPSLHLPWFPSVVKSVVVSSCNSVGNLFCYVGDREVCFGTDFKCRLFEWNCRDKAHGGNFWGEDLEFTERFGEKKRWRRANKSAFVFWVGSVPLAVFIELIAQVSLIINKIFPGSKNSHTWLSLDNQKYRGKLQHSFCAAHYYFLSQFINTVLREERFLETFPSTYPSYNL